MLNVKLDTGFNIEVEFTIPAFYKRLFAWSIDFLIMIAYYMIVSRVMSSVIGMSWTERMWMVVLFGLPPFCYHLLCEIFLNGQSIGKKALRIKVISEDGGQPSISQYLIRWLFRTVDLPIWILPAIGFNSLPWWSSVFLFGGLAQAGELLFNPTILSFEKNLLNIYRDKIKILPSSLPENDAPLLGAASLIWNELSGGV